MRSIAPTTPHASTPGTTPVVPPSLTRGMTVTVVTANAVAMLAVVGVVAAVGRADLWPAVIAGVAIGAIGAAASVVVLMQAAGRGVDWLPTFVLGGTACRLGVSAVGLLVAVQAMHTPAELTAVLVCLFYVITLVAESVSLRRAVGGGASVGDAHV